MPWVCTPTGLPTVAPTHALPLPTVHRGIGHGFRRTLRHWGASHGASVVAWHCVWIAPAVGGAGGVAYGVGRWLSGIGGGVAGGAVGALAPGAVVSVPEPWGLPAFIMATLLLVWIRGRRA